MSYPGFDPDPLRHLRELNEQMRKSMTPSYLREIAESTKRMQEAFAVSGALRIADPTRQFREMINLATNSEVIRMVKDSQATMRMLEGLDVTPLVTAAQLPTFRNLALDIGAFPKRPPPHCNPLHLRHSTSAVYNSASKLRRLLRKLRRRSRSSSSPWIRSPLRRWPQR